MRRHRLLSLLLMLLVLVACSNNQVDDTKKPVPEPQPLPPAERCDIFALLTPDDIPYRIPALAVTKDGTLIAVADYRHSGTDIGVTNNGRIDLHYALSHDNGNTWSDVMTLINGQGANSPDFMNVGFGDPCIVADRESNRVLLLSCAGNVSFQNGTRRNHQNIARFYSEDGGKSWSKPEDIAESIYSQFDNSIYGPVRSMFVASGRIFQSRMVKVNDYYRLYCAILVRDKSATHMNYVLYSDDFGASWTILGDKDTPAVYIVQPTSLRSRSFPMARYSSALVIMVVATTTSSSLPMLCRLLVIGRMQPSRVLRMEVLRLRITRQMARLCSSLWCVTAMARRCIYYCSRCH